MLLKAGVYLRVVGSRVEMGLRPLRRARFETSEVMDIELMEVPELAREWGTRGHARGENGLLFAVGGLRKALVFTLRDGRKFGITVEGTEQLVLDILALESDIANQNS